MIKTSKVVRTRFAPSPTGHLHLGSARTALFNWLYAKQTQGDFILRIEDSDVERSQELYSQSILESLAWLGLNQTEGPIYQSSRQERYQEIISQLLNTGHAYRCYCSKERLETLRANQFSKKEKPRYDGHCRDLDRSADSDTAFVVRFKTPKTGSVTFTDLVRGAITFSNDELDDLVIARSDGTPTYNLAVVVDDWDMKITDVIRGEDHINNTPRQIHIFTALGAEIPNYAHIPMILGSDGQRLSKRHGALNILEYRNDGYLPQALLNYLVRLGWSKGNQEIFSIEEMVESFTLKKVNHSAAIFNPSKLLWLNQHYLKTLPPKDLVPEFEFQLHRLNLEVSNGPAAEGVIALQAPRTKTLAEMAAQSSFFYKAAIIYDGDATDVLLNATSLVLLRALHNKFSELNEWDKTILHDTLTNLATLHQIKFGAIAQLLRAALTGHLVSPPIDITLELLGAEKVLERLNQAITLLEEQCLPG